jgi:hypothetical protein
MSCDATHILLEQGYCSQNSATNLPCLPGLAPRLVHFRWQVPAFRVALHVSGLHIGTFRGIVRFCGRFNVDRCRRQDVGLGVTQLEADQNASNQNLTVYKEFCVDICDGLAALVGWKA